MDKQGAGIMLPGGISEPKVTEAVELDLPKHVELKEPGEYGMSAGTEPYQRANISHRAISVEDLAIVMIFKEDRMLQKRCIHTIADPKQNHHRRQYSRYSPIEFCPCLPGRRDPFDSLCFFSCRPRAGRSAAAQVTCRVTSLPPCEPCDRM